MVSWATYGSRGVPPRLKVHHASWVLTSYAQSIGAWTAAPRHDTHHRQPGAGSASGLSAATAFAPSSAVVKVASDVDLGPVPGSNDQVIGPDATRVR